MDAQALANAACHPKEPDPTWHLSLDDRGPATCRRCGSTSHTDCKPTPHQGD